MAEQRRLPLSPPEEVFGPNAKHNVTPEPDRCYVLWNRDTGRVLCLDDGELVTRPPDLLDDAADISRV
ncbi:hypothetical protein QBC40DRAFT_251387 [Triangularia verruculosa]|uniref:Uncharacterized protein n=1 Tax=Triangularia verruculosa TaxID=2587418 RepID=A0AAN6XPT1_9PEZI|nr:hypothetical protein QBC40DRAFT_251387 [Triangularia verruculosa]